VQPEAEILRVHLEKSQLSKLSDILVDQPRAIDNKRFIKKTWRIEQRAGHPTQGKPESSSGLISTIINKSIWNGAGVWSNCLQSLFASILLPFIYHP